MNAVRTRVKLQEFETRLKRAVQPPQFAKALADIERVESEVADTDGFNRSVYYVLRGIAATRVATFGVKRFNQRHIQKLEDALESFEYAFGILRGMKFKAESRSDIFQIDMHLRRCVWEWAVAYTTLNALREDMGEVNVLPTESLSPVEKKMYVAALERKKVLETSFR